MTDTEEASTSAHFEGADRGISPISGRPGLGRRGQVLTVTALALGGGLFFLATGRHPEAKAAPPLEPVRQVVPFEPATPKPSGAPPSEAQSPAPAPPGATMSAASGAVSGGPQVPALATSSSPDGAAAAVAAPLMAFSRETGPSASASPASLRPIEAQSDGIATAHAHRLAHRRFSILAGASLPCVLLTAIDSATPGPVSCLIPADVYSETADVVLLEKGTRVTGDYVG